MVLNEKKGDLFELDNDVYSYAHCTSLDCKMGAGVAVLFDKKFKGMKAFLKSRILNDDIKFPTTIPCFSSKKLRVFNLITKEKYWQKPTYDTLTACVKQMREICERQNIHYLAMPKIGCGLDKLEWDKVRKIIEEEFKDLDIEIEVRYL